MIMETKHKDVLLEKFLEPSRWEYAIDVAIDKKIDRAAIQKLASPEFRVQLYRSIRDGKYEIAPPYILLVPKPTPGEFRQVYCNWPVDRVVLSIINDMLFELCPEMIHRSCRSYQKGMSCGDTVKQVASYMKKSSLSVPGYKTDLSKYFDKVPLRYIDETFDRVESKLGHSAIIDILRKYYHSGLYFDKGNVLHDKFDEYEHGQSLKQGCAVASFLADAILYDIDEMMTERCDIYLRYSDDMMFFDKNPEDALKALKDALAKKDILINDKKTEALRHDRWFRFLGFSIKDDSISIPKDRLKTFQKEIESRTIRRKKASLSRAVHSVNSYLYRGNGEYAWADQILTVCNVDEDLREMDKFVLDCLRAVVTGKKKIGGLGFVADGKKGCVVRGIGRNVTANRIKTEAVIEGYLSLITMRNARRTCRTAYDSLVRSLQ